MRLHPAPPKIVALLDDDDESYRDSAVAAGADAAVGKGRLERGAPAAARRALPRTPAREVTRGSDRPAPPARLNRRSARRRASPVVAGDLLVALRHRGELLAADHVLDALERPVAACAGTPRAGSRRAACVRFVSTTFDVAGSRAAPRRLAAPRPDRGARELVGEHARIEDRLPGAVRAARHHRMRRVAEQRHAAEASSAASGSWSTIGYSSIASRARGSAPARRASRSASRRRPDEVVDARRAAFQSRFGW